MQNQVAVKIEVPEVDKHLRRPPRYRVLMHNDKTTSYAIVYDVLSTIFQKNADEAELIVKEAEKEGVATVCITSENIAKSLISFAKQYMRNFSILGIDVKLEFTYEKE